LYPSEGERENRPPELPWNQRQAERRRLLQRARRAIQPAVGSSNDRGTSAAAAARAMTHRSIRLPPTRWGPRCLGATGPDQSKQRPPMSIGVLLKVWGQKHAFGTGVFAPGYCRRSLFSALATDSELNALNRR